VCFNGRVYEAAVAAIERRKRYDLYHSALEVRLADRRYVIEMTPVIGGTADHGAVADGAVGSPFLGRANLFGYEVRAWRDGMIPDVNEAASRRDAGMTVERS
jgi:hypothetical protein